MKYAWVKQHRDSFSVTSMCRTLDVSTSAMSGWAAEFLISEAFPSLPARLGHPRERSKALASMLLDAGAAVAAVTHHDSSALHIAACNGHADVAGLLVARG